jgi:hypothetical protein
VSTELVPVVVLLLIFLSVPVIMAIGLAAMLKFKRATSQPGEHHGHGTAMEASCFNTGADVRLCFTPLMQRWQKWRGRKVADSNQEEKLAAVLASAAILYSRQRSPGTRLGAQTVLPRSAREHGSTREQEKNMNPVPDPGNKLTENTETQRLHN